jgi:hypothetical protein
MIVTARLPYFRENIRGTGVQNNRVFERFTMKTRLTIALILVLFGISGGQVWGQRIRFVPIPGPAPIRPPVHVPIHPPTSFPKNPDPSHPNQPPGTQSRYDTSTFVVLVSIVMPLLAILALILIGVYGEDKLKARLLNLFMRNKLYPSSGLIRIVSTPPGEADRDIREAWVGLELPLARTRDQGQQLAAVEVLSGKQECTNGYAVEGRVALERLAAKSREAAAWWRENVPQVLDSRCQFIFPVENCQKLD